MPKKQRLYGNSGWDRETKAEDIARQVEVDFSGRNGLGAREYNAAYLKAKERLSEGMSKEDIRKQLVRVSPHHGLPLDNGKITGQEVENEKNVYIEQVRTNAIEDALAERPAAYKNPMSQWAGRP